MASLEIRHSLAALERLKQVVADFAAREARMTRGLDARRSEISWQYQAAIGGAEETEKTRQAEIGHSIGDEEARVRRVAKEREARVRRASAKALRNMPRTARELRGNWLANLQMRLVRADAGRVAALEGADAEAGRAAEVLTGECRRLVLLKREARKDFAWYWSFRARLREKTGQRGCEQQHAHPAGPVMEFREFHNVLQC